MFMSHLYRDYATYWEPDVPDMHGGSTYKAPRHLRVIWEDRVQLIVTEEGNELQSQARVFALQDLVTNGWLLHDVVNDAAPPSNARRILAFHKIRRLYGDGYERKAFL